MESGFAVQGKVELKQQIYPEPECSFSTLALDIDRARKFDLQIQ